MNYISGTSNGKDCTFFNLNKIGKHQNTCSNRVFFWATHVTNPVEHFLFLTQKVFEGTRVSVETFMTWKAKFDAEMHALKGSKEAEGEGKKRLTGRELFVADKTLNESDLSFLGEGKVYILLNEEQRNGWCFLECMSVYRQSFSP